MPLVFACVESIVDVKYMKKWINRHPRVKKTREAIFFEDSGVVRFFALYPDLTVPATMKSGGDSLKQAKEVIRERLKTFFLGCADKHEKREEQFANNLENWLVKYPNLNKTDAGIVIYREKSLFAAPIQDLRRQAIDHHPVDGKESMSDYIERIECVVDWSIEDALCRAYYEKFKIRPTLTEYEDIS